ncbi:MAG: glycosyltransferase family 39 protein [Bacteroidetes bacterium]|nr:glycosyltransferase family 39 protein [Bacteroidota bacterium]
MQSLKRNIDLILILVIGFALRFSVSITHSYTNDELSAINRLRYDSFSELIEKGVKQGDMHPAGVQVFEKIWTSFFGTSELALRLPFVLFGTASIFLIFLLGKTWFNRQTGIYAAAILSVLYFPIIQSELARPYSPGLFIALATAWFYHKVLFSDVKKYKDAILLGLCFAAGMYTHYFLFLSLLVIGFTGLFFLKKDNLKFYALAVVLAALLFIPHIPITLFHLGVGGLGWLGKPDHTFLFQFIFYAFNESWLVISFLTGLIFFWSFRKGKSVVFSKNFWLLTCWFLGIYTIGHIASLISTPILKFPVMLFAFPFLVLIIANLIAATKFKPTLISILLLLTASTLFQKDLYGIKHMGYRNTAQHLVEWNKKYGDENIYTVYNLSNPAYMNFYATKSGDTVNFDWSLIEFGDSHKLYEDLRFKMENLCVVGYSERLTLPQVFETVREFYPGIVEYHRFENSGVFLMSREDAEANAPKEQLFSAMDLYETNAPSWKIDPNALVQDTLKNRWLYQLKDDLVYGPDFTFRKSQADKMPHYYLKIKLKARCPHNAQLTATVTATRNGIPLENNGEVFWLGHDLEHMLISTRNVFNGEGEAFWAFEIPDFVRDTDEIKISLWNRNGKQVQISSFEIWLVENIWN